MGKGPRIGEGVKIRAINLSRKIVDCPQCRTPSKRHSLGHRWLRDLGVSAPTILEITYSKHFCPQCEQFFSVPMDHLAGDSCKFTKRVVETAVQLARGMPLTKAGEIMEHRHHVHVPATTLHEWAIAAIDE